MFGVATIIICFQKMILCCHDNAMTAILIFMIFLDGPSDSSDDEIILVELNVENGRGQMIRKSEEPEVQERDGQDKGRTGEAASQQEEESPPVLVKLFLYECLNRLSG